MLLRFGGNQVIIQVNTVIIGEDETIRKHFVIGVYPECAVFYEKNMKSIIKLEQ